MGDGYDFEEERRCSICRRQWRVRRSRSGIIVCPPCRAVLRADHKSEREERKLEKERAARPVSQPKAVKVRSLARGPWVWLPKRLVRSAKSVGKAGILVYGYLALYTRKGTEQAFPSQKKIADDLGMSKSTVRRGLRRLGGAGYVVWTRRAGRHRSGRLVYTLTDPL